MGVRIKFIAATAVSANHDILVGAAGQIADIYCQRVIIYVIYNLPVRRGRLLVAGGPRIRGAAGALQDDYVVILSGDDNVVVAVVVVARSLEVLKLYNTHVGAQSLPQVVRHAS